MELSGDPRPDEVREGLDPSELEAATGGVVEIIDGQESMFDDVKPDGQVVKAEVCTLFDLNEIMHPDHVANYTSQEGEMLRLVDVAVGEPVHTVMRGEVWMLSDRHHLIVSDLITEWPRWIPYLKPGCYFCPYPEPYITLTDKARCAPLVMVQPDLYLAGHVLDKHVRAYGEDSIRRVLAHVW